jgi:hypothetical protein
MSELQKIIEAVKSYRLPVGSEVELQDALSTVFEQNLVAFDREYVCDMLGSRIDFRVGGVGIEVKIKGWSVAEITRQLHRYAESHRFEHLLLITTSASHQQIAGVLAGVPVTVLRIEAQGLTGVARA